MGANTKIEWAHHTFNPWWGCTRVSPACAHCFAETIARRFAPGSWGASGQRPVATESYWHKPLAWNAAARRKRKRARVFCASMADVFEQLHDDHPDRSAIDQARERLWLTIERTEMLDWLLLTKRPQNITDHWPFEGLKPALANVWLGTTVEDTEVLDERCQALLRAPASVHFVSFEPLLSYVDARRYLGGLVFEPRDGGPWIRPGYGGGSHERVAGMGGAWHYGIDWAIAGGESGNGARPSDPMWFEALRQHCEDAEVPFFFKQWGSWAPARAVPSAVAKLARGKTELGAEPMVLVGKERAGRKLKAPWSTGRWRTFDEVPKQTNLML